MRRCSLPFGGSGFSVVVIDKQQQQDGNFISGPTTETSMANSRLGRVCTLQSGESTFECPAPYAHTRTANELAVNANLVLVEPKTVRLCLVQRCVQRPTHGKLECC